MTLEQAMQFKVNEKRPEKKYKDPVIVVCYNEREYWERSEAIKHYTEGMLACEGSEQGRYISIVNQLSHGSKVAYDLDQ